MAKPDMGTTRQDAIPHIHYDTRGWKVSDAVDFGREVLRPTYDFGLRNHQFHWYCTDIWLAGPLLLARNQGDGHLLLRESRHLSSNPGHYLKLQIFEEPGGMFFRPDEAVRLDPRSVHLIDQSQPYRQKMPSGGNFTVFLPHALLGFKPGSATQIRFDAASAEGGFLARSTQALIDQLPLMTVDQAAGIAGAYAGLVRSLLDWRQQSPLGGKDIREVRLDTARRYIEANLHNPDFRPDDVLRAVGASRATIFRDFAPVGGLATYLRERRLDHAYRALSMSNPQRGVVGIVAEASGFQSTAELSRAFQRRFGLAPTDVVGQWSNALSQGPAARPQVQSGLLHALRAVYNLSNPGGA